MLLARPQKDAVIDLGFSITHVAKGVTHAASSAVKSTAHVAAKGATATGHVAAKGATTTVHVGEKVGKIALLPITLPMEALTSLLFEPVRSRVHKMRDRRAKKLSWDRRKSLQPNAAENAEAKSWTKSRLKSKGPHGLLLALFAGAPEMGAHALLGNYQLGVAPAVAAALVPVLTAVASQIVSDVAKSGEAPANPQQPGAPPPAAETQEAAALAPAAAAALTSVSQAVSAAAPSAPPPAPMAPAPAPTAPPPAAAEPFWTPGLKKGAMIGGGVLAALIALSMFRRPSNSYPSTPQP